ncbi:MAG: serine protease [Bacteroidales bacterium]|nr:serine protease [Bacteroidales bacterium]
MKRIYLLTLLILFNLSCVVAQSPKWVKKARKAVFSVITYNDKDEILRTGNGFFVDSKGIGVSKYTLFEGAKRATILDADGKALDVEVVLGVDDLYDVIKFKVSTSKAVEALSPSKEKPQIGDAVYLLGYSTQQREESVSGKLKDISQVGDYNYYTLDISLNEKMISCPVMNVKGEVIGMSQESVESDVSVSYAVDVNYIMNQSISALAFNDLSLKKIGIKKGLPDTEEEALVFLFMISSHIKGEEYLSVLNDFISKFPNHPEGYIRRANYNALQDIENVENLKKAKADMQQAINVSTDKEETYYSYAKLIYNYNLLKAENSSEDWTLSDAIQIIDQAISINRYPVYLQLKADIYFAEAKYQEAFDLYQEVNKSDMASSATYFSAAKAKEMLNAKPEEIIVLLDSCISHLPDRVAETEAAYYLERAHVYSSMGEHRKALLDYDSFYEAMNGNVNDVFYYLRGQTARDSRLYQKALNDFTEAIMVNPNEIVYHIELGATNLRLGRNDEAEKNFKDAINIDPEYGEAYRLLGVTQVQQKNKLKACENFNKAKELDDPLVEDLIKRYCN